MFHSPKTGVVQPTVFSTSAALLSELTDHVARSSYRPSAERLPNENADAVLTRRRMDLMKTVAAMRANEDTFGSARPPARLRPITVTRVRTCETSRKALYPTRSTDRYHRIKDLKAAVGTSQGGNSAVLSPFSRRCSEPTTAVEQTTVSAVMRLDPRDAVAEKQRAALNSSKAHVLARVEQSLKSFNRSVGSVKPYVMSRSARLETRHGVTDHPFDTNNRYVDRMQCCRPSKGLYCYY